MKTVKKSKSSTLTTKRNYIGFLYVLPFIVGFLLFYAYPLAKSVIYSFGELDASSGYRVTLIGFSNYIKAIRVDTVFYQYIIEAIQDMALKLPVILVFSFLMANIIKPEFAGRNAVRLILFLPVVLSSGIVSQIEAGDMVQGIFSSMVSDESSLVSADELNQFLLNMGFPNAVSSFVIQAVEEISLIINSSGIQILIFLSALQSISPSLYEAASVEGATGWENFWLITFPMVIPQIIVCTVFTVIDLFCSSNNDVMQYIHTQAFSNMQFGLSAAMSWIFTVIILIALVIYVGVFTIIKRQYLKGAAA